jgi:Ala-tRNA(Pro) deacylase
MTQDIDASSRFQASLPVTSDEMIAMLDLWGIDYSRLDHVPLRTVEDSKKVQDQFLLTERGGGHIKNLYLRDTKKRNILVVAEQDRLIDLKALHQTLGTGRLSFGSADRLMENLGVRPGAVTPLAMVNGVKSGVQIYIDKTLENCKQIYVHPLVNDRTLGLTPKGLNAFFAKVDVVPKWIDL